MTRLSFFLILKALFALVLIQFSGIGLSPDEAQYWTWSQALDLGYYSKPPGIAWQIALTTKLFGQNELGVRFGAVVLSFLIPLAVYRLAKVSKLSQETCFWAALITAFSPFGIFFSFPATTDAGFILFFLLALIGLVEGPNYYLVGMWIFLGGLFKWTIFAFWPLCFIALIFFPALRKKSLIWGVLISLLALIPSLIWNATHDFATFKHVFKTVANNNGASGNFLDFLGAQIGIFSPIFFILFIFALFQHKKGVLKLNSLFVLGIFGYLALSFFKKMQANWAVYLYPPAFVLVAWYALEKLKNGKRWLILGTTLSLMICVGGFFIPTLQRHSLLAIPYKVNPFRQSLGGQNLALALLENGYDPSTHFLISDKYQTTSLLSFYGPLKKRAYFLNVSQSRKNQFSYWGGLDKHVGKEGYFVVIENIDEEEIPWFKDHYKERLLPYFEAVSFESAKPLFVANDKGVKWALLFKGKNYNGKLPLESGEY